MKPLSTAMRTLSIAVCLLAAVSFLLFALNQTSTASGQQQAELGSPPPAQTQNAGHPAREGSFHRTVDEVTESLTAPVSGVSSSAWGEHGLRLIFALLVYGFALGFLARLIRVRA
jgi:hypothetical protein